MFLYWLALEWPGLEKEIVARRWSKLSAYCSAAVPRVFFTYRYTLLTPSVEDAGRVSKSPAVAATFWLALAKVGCSVPSWLMAAVTALAQARALAKLMVATCSVPV
jgi:hypothetical protein